MNNYEIKFTYIISKYIKQYIKPILLFILFTLVFSLVFVLYNISTEPVIYASLLCCFIGLICICINFINYYIKHKALYKLHNEIYISLNNLPTPKNLIEDDYTNLILNLNDEYKNFISKSDNAQKDMIDYYTMWVHQIKTPISAMKLLIQTSECEVSSDLSSELFKIEQYVEMALHYSRLDSDTTDFVIRKISLDEIVREAVRKYAKLFIRKKIRLDYQPLNIEVLTDEKWLEFVIEQILSNAVKYTPKGTVSIYMENEDTLIIEDTGIGIRAEDLPRVCERGYTGYNGHSDKRSTGIGLYLCRRVLEQMSHSIEIESEMGKGTRVKIGLITKERIHE